MNMKKFWTLILGAFGIILGLFFFEKKKRQEAEAQLENAQYDSQDQVLKYQQGETEAKLKEEKQKIEQLKVEHDQANKENQENLTPEQVEAYWKNQGK